MKILGMLAARGASPCASNSGRGNEFPQSRVARFEGLSTAEIRSQSPNWPNPHFRHGLLVLLVFLSTAGMAQEVSYNFDRNTDFSRFRTYKWVEIGGGEQLDDITRNQLRSAIDDELAKKGLQRVEDGNADLYTALQVALREEREATIYDPGWGWRGGGFGTVQTNTIVHGSVVLDMYDAAQHQLVWRGVATKTVDVNAKPDKREKNIRKGAEKLLKHYPPKEKS